MPAKKASKAKADKAEKPPAAPTADPNLVRIQAPGHKFPALKPLDKAALVDKLQQALNIIGTTYPVAAKPLIQEVIDELKKG